MIVGVAANYGVLIRSDDGGQTWESLDVPDLTDIALNPANPDELALVTQRGLHMSEDGGRSFSLIRTEATPALLAWSTNGLFGATQQSVVRWDDSGNVWTPVLDGFSDIHGLAASPTVVAVLDDGSVTTIAD